MQSHQIVHEESLRARTSTTGMKISCRDHSYALLLRSQTIPPISHGSRERGSQVPWKHLPSTILHVRPDPHRQTSERRNPSLREMTKHLLSRRRCHLHKLSRHFRITPVVDPSSTNLYPCILRASQWLFWSSGRTEGVPSDSHTPLEFEMESFQIAASFSETLRSVQHETSLSATTRQLSSLLHVPFSSARYSSKKVSKQPNIEGQPKAHPQRLSLPRCPFPRHRVPLPNLPTTIQASRKHEI